MGEDSPTLVWSTCGIQTTWTSQPAPLISSGGSVIDTKDQLAQSIAPLLKG